MLHFIVIWCWWSSNSNHATPVAGSFAYDPYTSWFGPWALISARKCQVEEREGYNPSEEKIKSKTEFNG